MQYGVSIRRAPRIFYGWWIVAAAFVSNVIQGGTYHYGFSAFFLPLEREFGWSRSAIAGVVSLSRLQGGLLGPIEGFFVDRFGTRKMMLVGVLLMGLGFILLSFTGSLISFYLVFIFAIALGASIGLGTPTQTSLANWFVRRRSTVIGIVFCGIGVGAVLVPILAAAIDQYGWRSTSFALGILLLVVMVPLSAVFRHKPEQFGYLPDGEVPSERASAVARGAPRKTLASEQHFTLKQALKAASFWLMAVAFALRLLASHALSVHLIPFLVGQGFSTTEAAAALSLLGLISIVGRLGFGLLGDHLDKRYVLAVSNLMVAGGMVLLMGARTWAMVVLFLIVYAPGYGGFVPLSTAMRGDYFGRRYFATIGGAMGILTTLGTVGGPFLAGLVFDLTGRYQGAFLAFAVANLVAAVLILLARRPTLSKSA